MNIIENIRKKFGPSNREVVLGRLPEDLRRVIWTSKPEEVGTTLEIVNTVLSHRGIDVLSPLEVEDALEGNILYNRSKKP